MDEVIPNLWIGNLASAIFNKNKLEEHNIRSVVSAMKGEVSMHDGFIQHKIEIDDNEEEDIMVHFLPAIAFIQAELDKGRGVLVHCQAGISRSSTIVAAYLMYSRRIDSKAALDLIRKVRPYVWPNAGFMDQLQIFHKATFKVSNCDKNTRMFYLERSLEEARNGAGFTPTTKMFAKYPETLSDSMSPAPAGGGPQRRIRCKMCRQLLATREHMLDHGQPTPAPGSVTAVPPHSLPLSSPSDLAAQPHPNPNLSGLGASSSPVLQVQGIVQPTSPPTLSNPKCSGYFVEPMSWMEPFLEGGPLNGKILCPNKKCNAKLGNYDWAGVCCGCKEWVTPGFCINRSKVDEIF